MPFLGNYYVYLRNTVYEGVQWQNLQEFILNTIHKSNELSYKILCLQIPGIWNRCFRNLEIWTTYFRKPGIWNTWFRNPVIWTLPFRKVSLPVLWCQKTGKNWNDCRRDSHHALFSGNLKIPINGYNDSALFQGLKAIKHVYFAINHNYIRQPYYFGKSWRNMLYVFIYVKSMTISQSLPYHMIENHDTQDIHCL